MPAQLVSALGFVLAAVLGGLAFYYWKRSTGLYALLVEGANRFEELRQRGSQLEQHLVKHEERGKQSKDQTARLEKAVDEAREKAAALVQKLETKEHETRVISEKLELQKGHLEKQLGKADERLRVADEQRDAFAQRVATLEKELEQRQALAKQELLMREKELAAEARDVQAKLRDAEKAKEMIERKLAAVDPAEIKRYKRKLAQYDRLYASMKGLREMSEERNRNWEVALRKLSEWILKDGTDGEELPEAIGPLVGQAMQRIGAQLIDDHEPTVKGTGATLADSMDGPLNLDAEEAALAQERSGEALSEPQAVVPGSLRAGAAGST